MRMSLDTKAAAASIAQLVLEHAGEKQQWRVSPFKQKFIASGSEPLAHDVCEHINAYWASLPLPRQQQIFETYKEISGVFSIASDPMSLIIQLRPLVQKLYELHDLDHIERWLAFHAKNISIPVDIKETYVYSETTGGNRDKTYIASDYTKLLALALALRPMIPIWGEFIERTGRDTGTPFKEYYAFRLLAKTRLLESDAIKKLLIYIREHLRTDEASNALLMQTLVVDGVGWEDYDSWLLSRVLVTRVCVGNIRGNDPQGHLVVACYKYIRSCIAPSSSSGSNNFGDQIRTKDFKTSAQEEQEISRLEAYKIKQQLAIGEISPFEHFLSNVEDNLRRTYTQVDFQLWKLLMQQVPLLQRHQIRYGQIVLAQWVLSVVFDQTHTVETGPRHSARGFSPRALNHLDKDRALLAIIVAQTVLWQRGHRELAGLITATGTNNQNNMMALGGTGAAGRIDRELSERITQLYPYQHIGVNRTKTKPQNNALKAIDLVTQQFNTRDWIIMLPDALAVELMQTSTNRRYHCPHNIKNLLAKLAIEVAQREFAPPRPSNMSTVTI